MTKDNSFLKHFGILGMHWGVRTKRTPSSDHKKTIAIRKKKLSEMTDAELETASKRLELVSQYKSSFGRKKENPSRMSNDQLAKALTRRQLMKEDWLYGVRKDKQINKMTDEEVQKVLNRHLMEKKYRDLDPSSFARIRKRILQFLSKHGPPEKLIRS